ncbi:BQ5605_C001g00721 [Microbotryum silenes-dioicae]|uniref:BQ5605_C001g00721 protein n=1 Tax=Microbotryum silenes-dioicae TaxID=796604 RepID=A0A2X0P0P1_9BASI|nr:BQ5605_C001g00721 [Microbotryum silenes-dioicae]
MVQGSRHDDAMAAMADSSPRSRNDDWPGFTDVFPSSKFGPTPVVVMDGGMGTTLQAPPFSQNIDSALWSSELLATSEGRETLARLHATWVEAGAECIGYQSFLPLFLPRTSTHNCTQEAHETMLSALKCITSTSPEVRSTSSFSSTSRGHFPVLSLGPFGAVCYPGQEYAGLYPSPFGSRGTPAKIAYDVEAITLPSVPVTHDPEEDNLTAFHLRRLNDFVEAKEWNRMKLIAFETIPVVKEARATRRAMQIFNGRIAGNDGRSKARLPFYISFVFPLDGQGRIRYPDAGMVGSSLDEQMELLVEAVFGDREGEEVADGFGINCSNPTRIEEVLQSLHKAMKASSDVAKRTEKPWLVLYPDGGAVYDVFTKTWSNPLGLTVEQWASLLVENVESSLAIQSKRMGSRGDEALWGGVIAGGCCKAGPEAIRALGKELAARKLTTLA